MTRRLSIGYLVPGHHLVSSAGPTRNVLSLATALAEHADVKVAFRRNLEPNRELPFPVLELDPECRVPGVDRDGARPKDDAAIRGTSVLDLGGYVRRLEHFVHEHDFDVVLEKSWIFSGTLSQMYRRRGVPAALVENVVRVAGRGLASPRAWPRLLKHVVSQLVIERPMRRMELVIAETDELKEAILGRWPLAPERVEVIGLGVDHERFQPRDQGAARAELGLDPEACVLLYVGVLDRTHDLVPLLTALGDPALRTAPKFELHVCGDGEAREELESLARAARVDVRLHGRIEHALASTYYAACDLCVAPYDVAAFPRGVVAYSTLKIPEAMACARPVATVPNGRPGALIDDGVSGFLVANTTNAWGELLARLPDRATLARMGTAAHAAAQPIRWENTAAGYLAACERLVAPSARRR